VESEVLRKVLLMVELSLVTLKRERPVTEEPLELLKLLEETKWEWPG
jgi:hypothetical protein